MFIILRPISKLNEYKYTLNDIIISVTGSSRMYKIKAENITQIMITHKYSDFISPIIQIQASVTKEIYKLLTLAVRQTTELSAAIRLYKYNASSDVEAKEIVFSKSFRVLTEYELQPGDVKIYTWDTNDRQSSSEIHDSTNQLVEASFYVIDEERMSNYQRIKSYFLKSATNTDLISLIFSDRKFKSLLMNNIPGDSLGTRYLPAYNLMASIEYINNRYGLFNTEYIFYMDIVETYLLDKINLGKAIRSDSPNAVNLFLEEYASADSTSLGSVIYKNAHVVNIVTTPNVNTLETFIPYMAGSSISHIDTEDNINLQKDYTDKALLVFNSKIPKQIKHSIDEVKSTCIVGVSSIDISAIAPNLLYTITANPEYNKINKIGGNYRLNSSIITLVNSNNGNMGLAATLELVPIVK